MKVFFGDFGRGRPRYCEGRKVYDSLVAAAQRRLAERRSAQLTAREIAQMAGTNEGMIKYYFGSRDMLLSVVLRDQINEMSAGLADLESLVMDHPENPTWYLVQASARIAQSHLPSTILHSEETFNRTSILDEGYRSLKVNLSAQMSRIIHLLIERGIYSRRLDVRFATFTLTTLNTAPVLQAFALRKNGLTSEDMRSNEWLNFVASMLDQQFRNPCDLMINPSACDGSDAGTLPSRDGRRHGH